MTSRCHNSNDRSTTSRRSSRHRSNPGSAGRCDRSAATDRRRQFRAAQADRDDNAGWRNSSSVRTDLASHPRRPTNRRQPKWSHPQSASEAAVTIPRKRD